jgi:YVTN family beta-propeller protein
MYRELGSGIALKSNVAVFLLKQRSQEMKRSAMAYSPLFAILSVVIVVSAATAETYKSPVSVMASQDGATLYVCAYTANQVLAVDVASQTVKNTFDLAAPPSGITAHPSGSPLFVTGDTPQGKVFALSTDGTVLYELAVGHSPVAPTISADGNILFVCNRFDNTVSIIDLASKTETARVAVAREPIALAVTPDGQKLFVANHLPTGKADGDYIASQVSVIDVAAKQVSSTIALPNGSSSLRGICTSPDGAHVYVTHLLSRYQLPTTQLERGWMNTNALTIIDTATATAINTVLLDDVSRGAANPWGVACTSDGNFICVAHAGTHEISVIDRAAMHDKLARVAAGESVSSVSKKPEDVPNDLSFLVNLRKRIKLDGNGPRGIAVIGTTVYAAEYFTDSLGVVDVAAEIARPQKWSLGADMKPCAIRQGEIFFNDADLCFQQWQSCASCHPDARADGLNWDLLNDGIGNPKSTKNMLLAHQTPPSMGLGIRATAEVAVRAGIKHIQFAVRPEEDAVAIDEYLKSLTPVPSPELVNGQLSEAAVRGEKIFETAGCAECHPAPLYTNLKTYNFDMGTFLDEGKAFDTPTLVEVWRTAPYLHDGRAATLHDVLTIHNPENKHGETTGLTETELDDLVAYVRSL